MSPETPVNRADGAGGIDFQLYVVAEMEDGLDAVAAT
jgi:hypothetical protein